MSMKFSDDAPIVIRDGDLIKVTIFAKDEEGKRQVVGRCTFTRHAATGMLERISMALSEEVAGKPCEVLEFKRC